MGRVGIARPVWRIYAGVARAWFGLRRFPYDPSYSRQGFLQGRMDDGKIAELVKHLKEARTRECTAWDTRAGYVANDEVDLMAQKYGARFDFVELGTHEKELLSSLLAQLKDPVARALGSPWRIVDTRSWRTPPDPPDKGLYAWHSDQFPSPIAKILVYLTGASRQKGTTELRLHDQNRMVVEGPPGTWVLFKISHILHRALPPVESERIVLQLTIAPSFTFKLEPVVAGLNAQYPITPWHCL